MAAADILNPAATSDLNPTYGYTEGLPETLVTFKPRSGPRVTRFFEDQGRTYGLQWANRLAVTADALRQWEAQFREDFFSYQDLERARYFSGTFDGPLVYVPAGNDNWSISGVFVEVPGLAMFAYPTNWARDAIFLEERNGSGVDRTKQTGVWTYGANANAHGGAELLNGGLINTDACEIMYFGYGFRLWARKDANLGQFELSLDGVVVAATIDLYAAAPAAAAVVSTQANVVLGMHRVKARPLHTKNAASSDFKIPFDAIEVMR
jgi:hypothetical protein